MNTQRFVLTVVASFIFISVFEFIWHGFLMRGLYEETISVWRPEGEGNMAFIFGAHFLLALVLSFIYTKIGKHISCKRGIAYGFFAGLLLAAPQLGTYCYMPIPLTITLLWMLDSIVVCTGTGMVIAAIYKEKTAIIIQRK